MEQARREQGNLSATLIGVAGVAAYHLLAASRLAAGAYGTLAMLMAVVGLVSAPLSTMHTRSPRRALGWAWVLATTLCLAAPLVRERLHLGVGDLEIRLVALLLLVAPLNAHLRSKLQARSVLTVHAAATAGVRVFAVVAMAVPYGLQGAVLAAVLAESVGIAIGAVGQRLAKPVSSSVAMASQTSLAVSQSSDIILGAWLLMPNSHGVYALAASLVRAFVPIGAVFSSSKRALMWALLSAGVLVVGAGPLLELAGGSFSIATNELRWRGLALLPAVVFVTHGPRFASRRAPIAHAGWLVALGLVCAGVFWDVTPPALAVLTFAFNVAVAGLVLIGARTEQRHFARSHRTDVLAALTGAPALSILIPSFNPTPAALCKTITGLYAELAADGRDSEIVVVDDGSTDGSAAALAGAFSLELPELGAQASVQRGSVRLLLVRHTANAGKGAALATGLRSSRGDHVGMLDADGDIDPSHMLRYADLLRAHGADAVIGSKNHAESSHANSALRRVWSYGFQLCASVLLGMPRRDTQVGAKVFRREVFEAVGSCQERGFLLDPELLLAASRLGYSNVIEAAVTVNERHTTTTSALTAPKMLLGLARLGMRARVLRMYEAGSAPAGSVRADVFV